MAFIETTYKGTKILESSLLKERPELFHAFFLKETSPEKVPELLNLPVQTLRQIHSNLVEEAPPQKEADALITSQKNLPLLIRHADCQAALFYDPVTGWSAAAHAGWRGLVQEIYTQVVLKLKNEHGVNPANLLCAIGPSIGPEHAEFQGWRDYFPPHFAAFEVKDNYFDLRQVARSELLSLGLLPEHLDIADECTFADPTRFHSYRRDKTTLRLASVLSLIS